MSGRKRIVIIGLGTSGLYASRAALRTSRDAEVIFIEKRDFDMFSPCGLPFAIEGEVDKVEDLIYSVPTTSRLSKLLGHEAISIDTDGKQVKVRELKSNKESDISYDSLIIATGSKPQISPVRGASRFLGKGVYVLSTIEDARMIKKAASKSKRAVVIGNGATGLEVACALNKLGLEVLIIGRRQTPLPRSLDPNMGDIVLDHLRDLNIQIHFGKTAEKINGKENVDSVTFNGIRVPADMVVVAIGSVPETEIAVNAGVETQWRAIVTNSRMETNVVDVYAIGDCALKYCDVDKKPLKLELAVTAYRMGIVAGINAAGGEAFFEGTCGTFLSYVGGLEVASTGYNSSIAEERGFKVLTGRIKMKNRPGYMSDAKDVTVKLVIDADTGRLLGGQAIGEEGASWRVNIIALGIKKQMTIREFSEIELSYCPKISDLYDPLLAAADSTMRRFDREKSLKNE
jgi:NADPH-dependent 2,4-dienoyl-CoA reductase/sulfur reductase-like enzyme